MDTTLDNTLRNKVSGTAFEKNQVMVRAIMRGDFSVYRPNQLGRLIVGEKLQEARLGEPAKKHLAQIASEPDFSRLKALIQEQQALVFDIFKTIFEVERAEEES